MHHRGIDYKIANSTLFEIMHLYASAVNQMADAYPEFTVHRNHKYLAQERYWYMSSKKMGQGAHPFFSL
jgi:hypothetical protein